MTATIRTGWDLSTTELATLVDVVGSDTLAGVPAASRADRRHALDSLAGRGLLDRDGVTDPGLAASLHRLADPHLQITLRCRAAGLVTTLAVDTGGAALAVHHTPHHTTVDAPAATATATSGDTGDSSGTGETGDTSGTGDTGLSGSRAVIRDVWASDSRAAARLLGEVLDHTIGTTCAAAVPSARFPLHQIAEHLRTCHDSHDVAAAFASGGLPAADASRLAAAVTTARHRTEIVTRVRVDGLATTSVGAIAVFDGPAGRVIAAPDLSVDGTPWTTFSPGTAIRLEQALGRLVAGVPGADVPWDPPPGDVA